MPETLKTKLDGESANTHVVHRHAFTDACVYVYIYVYVYIDIHIYTHNKFANKILRNGSRLTNPKRKGGNKTKCFSVC